ncbi:helix-turn-helix domain-containing protein [Ramlibacter sp.]|uniref:helix-turn-helix domain-containing protein n=1 Tax=Ramlibacter sp. TaxID=1917967 RepID=UPI003D0E22D9
MNLVSAFGEKQLTQLGDAVRDARSRQRVSAVAAAESAGISRMTLHRIERGEPGVAIGAWVAIASALGLKLSLLDVVAQPLPPDLPPSIRLVDYPQLRGLAWQLGDAATLAPKDALDLYERNWRHVDRAQLSLKEAALIHALSTALGEGRLLV